MNLKITSSSAIGAITGLLLILCHVFLFPRFSQFAQLQYLQYLMYAVAIGLAIYLNFPKTAAPKFGLLFAEGFKCFIPIVLSMAVFAYANMSGPNKEKVVNEYATQVEKTITDKTPEQKQEMIKQFSKGVRIFNVSSWVFSFLFFGAIFSLILSLIILNIKKQQA